jgi:hypothetical protein
MENHPVSPFKGKNQQKRDGLNSPLLGLQQDNMSKPSHLPASSETSLRGVSEHLRFVWGLSPGVSDTGRPTTTSPHRPSPRIGIFLSPPRPRPASNAAPPLAHSRPPVTSPTFLRLPNRTSQKWPGSNHHAIVRNKHGEELLTTIPPILALYAWFVPAQCTKQPS